MGWIQSRGSRPFKPAAGTSLLRQSVVAAPVGRYQQRPKLSTEGRIASQGKGKTVAVGVAVGVAVPSGVGLATGVGVGVAALLPPPSLVSFL